MPANRDATFELDSLLRLLLDSPTRLFISILFGILAGIAYSLMIPVVLTALEDNPLMHIQSQTAASYYLLGYEISSPKFALAFFCLCLVILLFRSLSQVLFTMIAVESEKTLRCLLYSRITRLPIAHLERIGPSRLNTAMHEDIPKIIDGASILPLVLINLFTALGLLGFLVYLDVGVFLFIVGVIAFGIISYRIPAYLGQRYFVRARNHLGNIHEGYRGLVYGAKELKLNKKRRNDFLQEELFAEEYKYVRLKKIGNSILLTAVNYGNMISFLTIGVVTFLLSNYHALNKETLVGIVMALLYLATPLNILMTAIIPIITARVALKKFNRLLSLMPQEVEGDESGAISFDKISARELCYQYLPQDEDDDETGFSIGPISLSLTRGEVVFIVGGNGSGKSTLGKLLSMHYLPSSGSLQLGEVEISEQNRDIGRQYISSISSDFYLFKKFFGVDNRELEIAAAYLKSLHLDRKVKVTDGGFSTTSLSDGQKKRLALVVSYLDDRDVYVFDEWAADQDPGFKEIFYNSILLQLKKAGKIVIVISHDENYFKVADKIVEMEGGLMKSCNSNRAYLEMA